MRADDVKSKLREDGHAVIPDVLSRAEADEVLKRLWLASEESERRGVPTRNVGIDPNDRNVRVFNLLDLDPVFRDLIAHPLAIEIVSDLLTSQFLISNFTANIALPGSQSMVMHSDQAVVIPEPWYQPWAINIIWCLTDVRRDNGATLYLPGSHRITWAREVPDDARARMVPFEAKAGSIIAMEGRIWHTSGANVTRDEERALLFGYYTRDFIRPQVNWNAALSDETVAALSPQMQAWLGLGANANVRLAVPLATKRTG
jgi:5-dehydro-6-demethoxyfumagillol dioxygenase